MVSAIEVARATGIPKSSAARLLNNMSSSGLLQKLGLLYAPSDVIYNVADRFERKYSLSDLMVLRLKKISQETGYTGYVSELDGGVMIVKFGILGAIELRTPTLPGETYPPAGTATGRVLLARLDDAELRNYLPENTPDIVFETINVVRENGLSIAIDEAVSGVCSIACAIRDGAARETLSFCISLPEWVIANNPGAEKQVSSIVYSAGVDIGSQVGDQYWVSRKNRISP